MDSVWTLTCRSQRYAWFVSNLIVIYVAKVYLKWTTNSKGLACVSFIVFVSLIGEESQNRGSVVYVKAKKSTYLLTPFFYRSEILKNDSLCKRGKSGAPRTPGFWI